MYRQESVQPGRSGAAAGWISGHEWRLAVLTAILATTIASTAIHYGHNFVAVDRYPQVDWISTTATRVAIIIAWPLLTAVGLVGYWLYAHRSYGRAHACLAIYSITGLVTLGHFLQGSPDIAAVWYATIFSDALLGLAVLAFVAWSALAVGRGEPATGRA